MLILSLDGGGTCGVVTLRFLEKLGIRYADDFDLLMGTSSGGIICLGLAKGFTPDKIREVYYGLGKSVFRVSWWKKLLNPFGLFEPRFEIHALKDLLKSFFYTTKIHELEHNVAVVTYDFEREVRKIWRSWAGENREVYEIATATGAAPWYFSGYDRYSDGGLVATNPSLLAIREALKLGADLQSIDLVSIGSGVSVIGTHDNKHGGALTWAPEIASTFMKTQVCAANSICHELPLKSYKRYDVDLPKGLCDMVDVSRFTLRAREALVDHLWANFHVA